MPFYVYYLSNSRERSHMGRVNEEVEAENGTVLKYQHHANGRGFVSPKARVQASTFVAATAYIEADARIGDNGTIGSGSWIDQGVVLGERVFIGQNVHIGRDTVVGNDVRLGSHSRIGTNVRIAGGMRIDADAQVANAAVLGTPRESAMPVKRPAGRVSSYVSDKAA